MGWHGVSGLDLAAFLTTYPLPAHYPSADIYHLSSQNLASLLRWRRLPGRVVVTVHDIFPYLLRDDAHFGYRASRVERIFDRWAMQGLAQRRPVDCGFVPTRRRRSRTIWGIDPSRIHVVHLGVDHARFRPCLVPETLAARYGFRPDVAT